MKDFCKINLCKMFKTMQGFTVTDGDEVQGNLDIQAFSDCRKALSDRPEIYRPIKPNE